MQKLIICLIFGAALLSACGAAQVQDSANQVGTAVSGSDAATAVSLGSTALAMPEMGTAEALMGTAVAAPEMGTAVAAISGSLQATAADTMIQDGQALVLDATQSVGNYPGLQVDHRPGARWCRGSGWPGDPGKLNRECLAEPRCLRQIFPTAGDYTVRLTVTGYTGGQLERRLHDHDALADLE